jgi:hypothetical protein
MDFLAVALITNSWRMDNSEDRPDLMANVRVTVCTFDLVVRNVILMHELSRIFGAQYFWLIVALDTFPLRNMTIPLNNVDMAPLTDDPPCNILPMIKIPTFDFNISFGFEMARGTPSYRTRNALLLPSGASLVVVANETIDLMDGEVRSLNELGVAGRTAKFHSPPQLA